VLLFIVDTPKTPFDAEDSQIPSIYLFLLFQSTDIIQVNNHNVYLD